VLLLVHVPALLLLLLLLLLLPLLRFPHFLHSFGHDAFFDAHLPGPRLM
jgi:hypothetical protein